MHIQAIHTGWPEKRGFELKRNKEESYYVFVHFLSNVMFENNEKVYAGGCIFYKPYSYRFFKAEETALLHDWFHIDGEIEGCAKKYGLEMNRVYYPENSRDITEIVRSMELEMLAAKKFSDEVCNLKTEELIAKMSRSPKEKGYLRIDGKVYEDFIHLREYMQSDYFKIKNVEPLAERVNLSVSRFYSLYKEVFGISPKRDLINIRLEHAKNLLNNSNKSLEELSEILGYSNQYHFIRQFKAFTGITPAKYGKMNGCR